MKNYRKLFIVLILSFVFLTGWTSKTHQKIAADATKLTPYELKLLLKHYKEDLLKGAISPLSGKKGENHFLLVDSSYGTAHKEISKSVQRLIMSLKQKKIGLSRFCFEMGRLSHFVAEINNPILTGDLKKEGSWFYTKFVNYTDANINKYALTFDTFKNPHLKNKDWEGFAIATAIRSAGLFKNLHTIYKQEYKRGGAFIFDDKSIPFAAASLSYNYAVTDTAKLWYYVWYELTRDVSFTPFDQKKKGRK